DSVLNGFGSLSLSFRKRNAVNFSPTSLEDFEEKNLSVGGMYKEYVATYARANKAASSIRIDHIALEDAASFFSSKKPIRLITQTNVVRFQKWLLYDKIVSKAQHDESGNITKPEVKGLSATTVNIKMRTLKAIFNWAKHSERKHVDPNPFAGVKEIRTEKKLVFTMTPGEVNAVFAQADKDGNAGQKWKRFVEFLFMTACRRNEAFEEKTQKQRQQIKKQGCYIFALRAGKGFTP
ncbi:MAG: phage integrase SAM-like domain-containing protein, partial [Bacteroidota bacterium]